MRLGLGLGLGGREGRLRGRAGNRERVTGSIGET